MTLGKRGNVWWTYFWIDGVRHQESTGTANRRRAEQIAQKIREDANAAQYGVRRTDPDLTFGALAAHFIANAKPTTYHLDRLKPLLSYFADVPVIRLSKADVRKYRESRQAQATRLLKDATINRDLAVFRHLLYWGVDEGLLSANPVGRLRLPPERPTGRPVVTVAEEQQLLAAAPPHLAALIVMALDTGMRRGELTSQRWEHVDFARKVLTVTHSKTVQGEQREIPLTTRVEQLLNICRPLTGLIFEYRGHALHTIATTWRTTRRKAGTTRHIRFHDLRHTFNTRLLEAGVLQEVRKSLMGHVSGGGINARYTHIEIGLKREAIAALERWHAGQLEQTSTTAQEDTHERTTGAGHETAGQDGRSTKAVEEEDRRSGRH